jgi:hypothetical protein
MIAIHETLSIINTQYPNEPAFIFTDSLNVLYLLNTLYKVRAHVNIDGNKKADKLAKEGLEVEHRIATHSYNTPTPPRTITKKTYGPRWKTSRTKAQSDS